MIPKINYQLLGEAVAAYESRGYQYVEAPWFVEEGVIRATLPPPYEPLRLGADYGDVGYGSYIIDDCLVGSGEQGLLSKHLAPGFYLAVTPCFRMEDHVGLFNQIGFMKAELFIVPKSHQDAKMMLERVITDACEVMALLCGRRPVTVSTDDGYDLEIGGVEVGSYGIRSHPEHGMWVYGTGLALPRFSVANAIDAVT